MLYLKTRWDGLGSPIVEDFEIIKEEDILKSSLSSNETIEGPYHCMLHAAYDLGFDYKFNIKDCNFNSK